MEVKYEVRVTIDSAEALYKELTVTNTDSAVIKAAILAAIKQCYDTCITDVGELIDNA